MFDRLLKAMGDMGIAKSAPKNKTGKNVVAQKLTTAQKTNVLSLTEHGLEEIPSQVYQILALRTLDLSKNKIRNLGRISVFKELKSLNCDENLLGIGALIQISQLANLQTLSLGKNRIKYPNEHGTSFPSLPPKVKQLKLHSNEFSMIPREILDPCPQRINATLEKLDMSSNNVAAIPSEIGNLKALTELILDENVITSLPMEMGELMSLKVLSLKNNFIQVRNTHFSLANPQPIPASLFENTLLIDLNLHGNKLTSTQLNEFEGFDAFLERRKIVKTKGLIGGAMDGDSTLCGLK